MKDDDRRLLAAFVLSMCVFLLYQVYITHKYPVPPTNPSSSEVAGDSSHVVSTTDTPLERVKSIVVNAPQSIDEPGKVGEDEETHVLVGDGLEVTTSSRMGGIRQIRLTGIARIPNRDSRDVILLRDPWPHTFGGMHIPGSAPATFSTLLAAPDRVRYVLKISPGLDIEREIAATGRRYEVQIRTRIRNMSDKQIHSGTDSSTAMGFFLTPFPVKEAKTELDIHELFVKLGDDVVHRQEPTPGFFDNLFGRGPKPVGEHRETLEGVLHWISLGDRYFTLTLIPDPPLARADLSMKGPEISGTAQYGAWILPPGQEKSFVETVYAGPKIPKNLREYGSDLLEIMNFGWFDWLGFGMLWLMNQFHRWIANYGVAIILLTVVVRIVLYPLTYTSYVSMAKLKDLAPKLKVVQDKYADNRDKLNKEMMRLYKENKVNPAGGCLPILLQIPVFIAFYRMLQYAIELRGASFWWVSDLSEKDPYYILPVLMGVSMLIQQKMTPTADPNQAKIGMFMTIVFTFLFLGFPGGLNLYWFVSTVLGICQQKMIERKLLKTKKSEIPPP